eukprot:TRINITY_DN18470_c0_g1_i1.p1 TRINITY_DN18470_c0_g1~~TRINITY_DN18470_c0_g1_i1.p1  ORF type:complete len:142 (-),score=11.66 TRINITY_DN18470_c0_g1_i1:293-718(-)
MAVVLFRASGSTSLVTESDGLGKVFNHQITDTQTLWKSSKEVNGVEMYLSLDLIVDDSGYGLTIGPNVFFPGLFGDVVLSASWGAYSKQMSLEKDLDIRLVLDIQDDQVVRNIYGTFHSKFVSTSLRPPEVHSKLYIPKTT